MHCEIPTADLEQRLHGTICLYDGIPYSIAANHGNDEIELYDMINRRTVMARVSSRDKKLDIATPPLGYCQVTDVTVAYISRKPFRQYKQGITSHTIFASPIKNPASVHYFSLFSQAMKNTMMGVYPNFNHIIRTLRGSISPIELAISNDCAVVKFDTGFVKVLFREEEVGLISKKELQKNRPTVVVPSTRMGWLISEHLSQFEWEVE